MLWGPWKYMSEDSLRDYLRAGASDLLAAGFMYDDLIKKKLPKQYEDVFIEAAQFQDIAEPDTFLRVCVVQLLRLKSGWDGLEKVLLRLVDLRPGISSYQLVYDYAKGRNWEISAELGRKVTETHAGRTRLHKFFIWLDGPSRVVVKRCAGLTPYQKLPGSAVDV
jgi:hypothetical protein